MMVDVLALSTLLLTMFIIGPVCLSLMPPDAGTSSIGSRRGFVSSANRPSTTFFDNLEDLLQSTIPDRNLSILSLKSSVCRRQFIAVATPVFFSGHFAEAASARNLPESTGADTSKRGTVETLVPIVGMEHALHDAEEALKDKDVNLEWVSTNLKQALPTGEVSFKRIFDEYSEPVSYKQKFLDQNAFLVYYTKGYDGPNRPSIEEQSYGEQKQALQFGARNDAWVAWQELQSELEFAKKEKDDIGDVQPLVRQAYNAIQSYIMLAPEGDVQKATKLLTTMQQQ